jgi:hypothetical protein
VGEACGANGEEERVWIIGRKPRGKETTRKTKKWVYIKMDLVEKRWGSVDWISLAQDRDNELSSSIKCCETIEWLHNW